MLSYRHGFHAGNHADILKHLTLCLLLRSLKRKDKPFSILDSHSGGGLYELNSQMAQKTCEYQGGILKVLNNKKLQELVPEYYEVLKKINDNPAVLTEQNLKYYPGSPLIEAHLMRDQDRLTLVDLHPREYQSLLINFGRDKRTNIQQIDAFHALSQLLPPPIKRGLVFIDPPYEERNEYYEVVKALKQGLSRFNTGIFAVWYPVLSGLKDESKKLVQDVRRLKLPLLQAEVCIEKQSDDDIGMIGSGMLIVNYPYKLDEELEAVVGELYQVFAAPNRASAKLKVLAEQP